MDITVKWSGPSDAAAGSTYKVERTLDWTTWTTLAAAQAATAPYVSPSSTLSGDHDYGASTVALADASAFSTSGYAWVDGEAYIQWTGKSGNNLTGVTWHSGYGTYLSGSAVTEAHEYYTDLGVTPSNNAVVYRITHIDGNGVASAPAYLWHYDPPAPASSRHCVVIVNVGADVGVDPQSGINVKCYLASDDQFAKGGGQHLDSDNVSANTAATNALGLAFFHCWRDSEREGNATDNYKFVLDSDDLSKQQVFTATSIPDRDWVLLSDIT